MQAVMGVTSRVRHSSGHAHASPDHVPKISHTCTAEGHPRIDMDIRGTLKGPVALNTASVAVGQVSCDVSGISMTRTGGGQVQLEIQQ